MWRLLGKRPDKYFDELTTELMMRKIYSRWYQNLSHGKRNETVVSEIQFSIVTPTLDMKMGYISVSPTFS